MSELLIFLERAFGGARDDVSRFLNLLFSLEFFVPLPLEAPSSVESGSPGPLREGGGRALDPVGPDDCCYFCVISEGKFSVPIFSEMAFLRSWAGDDLRCAQEPFLTILASLPPDFWLHLNPSQEYGKEFSPWEIDRLKRGPESVEEVVFELAAFPDELEVDSGGHLFGDLKRQLLPILESYSGVREAFLLSVSGDELGQGLPFLGLRCAGISSEGLDGLRAELRSVVDSGVGGVRDILLVDDIDNFANTRALLFKEQLPFYVAQRKLETPPGLLSRVLKSFRRG